ncbi:MAG TPA: LON peptidase substrate-binding domain-containing protein [Bacteroidota bacterium]|nr:LON peptidase substrate-binding domain-containing protein [Bacteroidota bacterium]
MREELLPLFPLQVVLFPNSALPLHIFEERYKILMNECLEEEKEFGINLVHGDTVSDVGCTAVVKEVYRRYDDGRMDIAVEGRRRYELQRYDTLAAPYLLGVVKYLNVPDEGVDEDLAHATVSLYNKLIATVYRGKLPQVSQGKVTRELSFLLAQKSGMDLLQRQRLLETLSENERLRMLHSYLAEVFPKLHEYQQIERVVKSDGYL